MLNYVFTELMDDSGLYVEAYSGRLRTDAKPELCAMIDEKECSDAEAAKIFRGLLEVACDEHGEQQLGASGGLRLEVAEHKAAVPPAGDDVEAPMPTFGVWQVGKSPEPSALPQLLSAKLDLADRLSLRTVWPERAKWRVGSKPTGKEKPFRPHVGRYGLLVQQVTMEVHADGADAFKRLWPDLGFRALTEPQLLRCDLLQSVDDPRVFVARKVFKFARAMEAHEASVHYSTWREAAAPLLKGEPAEAVLMDTHYPITWVVPFRTLW